MSSYGSIPNQPLKLILLDYENSLHTTEKTKFSLNEINNSKLTIEHIAPQSNIPSVKPIENINLIGNLVLTFNNSELNNRTFISKRNDYGNSKLASERELIDFNDWSDKSIIERGKKIQKFILDKWKV